jgi:hypothetical protein
MVQVYVSISQMQADRGIFEKNQLSGSPIEPAVV